jgi:hypothetical protein
LLSLLRVSYFISKQYQCALKITAWYLLFCDTQFSSPFVPLWGLRFSLPGFAHNTRKEYGQMLNPEVQDQISMCLYPTSGQLTVVECNLVF